MIISPLSIIFKLRFWIYELFKGWFQWNTNKDKIYSIIYIQNLKNKPIDINIFWKMMELNIMQIQIKLSDIQQQNMNFCPSYLTRLFVHSCCSLFHSFGFLLFFFLFFVSKSATHFRYYIRICFGILDSLF